MFLAYAYCHVALVAALATMVLFTGIVLLLVNQSTTVYITAILGALSCRLGLGGRTAVELQLYITDDEPKLQCGGILERCLWFALNELLDVYGSSKVFFVKQDSFVEVDESSTKQFTVC
uniref:Uncharacterized protein n=1 Tax=Glossina austeni TaxID=7395 RepID=A0A1A9VB56_GLOAU